MALLGNFSVYNKGPGLFLAGVGSGATNPVTVEAQVRSTFNKAGAIRNFILMDGASGAADTLAIPTGNYPPNTWMIPKTAGEMSTGPNVSGSGSTGTPNLAGGVNISAGLTGTGSTNVGLNAIAICAASLSGAGDITSSVMNALGVMQAALTGSGNVASTLNALGALIASVSGSGDVTNAALIGVQSAFMVAALSGSGSVSALVNALGTLQASVSGSGNITNAAGVAALPLGASLSGSGDITGNANLNALGNLLAGLAGSSSLSPTLNAIGVMGATIKSYSDLTAQGAADAVWAQLLEGGYSAEQLMRLLSAALAGKVSGASGTTVTIRDINDLVDRIVATVDTSGDRTSITYDVN